MDIVERIKSFDAKNPDWHLIDVVRNVSFANLLNGDTDFTKKLITIKKFVECNVAAREAAHKKVFEVCGKMVQEKFVEISREITVKNFS